MPLSVFLADSTGNRVNESETAEMPLLSKEDVDGVNEQLMMSAV